MGNLLGEPFNRYISDQIYVRQEVHGKKLNRTSSDIAYLNSRNAWVKLASGVSLEEKRLKLLRDRDNPMVDNVSPGQDLATKNVLFNGLTSLGSSTLQDPTDITSIDTFKYNQQQKSGIKGPNKAYGVGGNDFGYSPMPGIISVNVRDLNRGSIKKATLNIKCHNKNQLDVIDVLYMRLGYTVLLEWGYDKYLNSLGVLENMDTTLIDDTFFNQEYKKSDYTKFLPLIEEKRRSTSGNYDAMFGTISNFSWTFESDGSYNVKIEMISLGDIIESLKVNVPSSISSGTDIRNLNLQRLQEKGGVVSQEDFYSTLYPGLEETLNKYYNTYAASFDPFTSARRPVSGETYAGSLVFEINPSVSETISFDYTSILEENKENVQKGLGNQVRRNKSLVNTKEYISDMLATFFLPRNFKNRFKDQYLIIRSKKTFQLRSLGITNGVTNILPPPGKPLSGLKEQDNFLVLNEGLFPFLESIDTSTGAIVRAFTRTSLTPGGRAGFAELGPEGLSFGSSSFPINQLQKDIIFTLFTFEDFKTQVYNDFRSKGLASFGEEDTTISEEGEVEATLTSFERIGQERKNKNIIFEYFWNIRFLFEGKFEKKILEREGGILKNLFKKDIIQEDVIFKNLNNQPKINTFNELMGYILNPISTLDPSYWNNKIEYPKYSSNNEFRFFNPTPPTTLGANPILSQVNNAIQSPQKDNSNSPVDFIKLNVFPIEDSYFIRLGVFLEYLQNVVIPKIEVDGKKVPLILFDTNIKDNICYVIDNTISLDIRKCIVKNDKFYTALVNDQQDGFTKIFEGLNDYIITDGETKWGQIMNIYCNFSRLEQIMENVDTEDKISLFEALKAICDDINSSLGNINNLEPTIKEGSNTITIIDQTPIPGINQVISKIGYPNFNTDLEYQPVLEVFGYNPKDKTSNFIHNIGLTTEISKEYATMITIGATANGSVPGTEATAFSTWNTGIFDRFKNNLTDGTGEEEPKEQNKRVLENYAFFIKSNYQLLGLNEKTGDENTIKKMLIINSDFISSNKDVNSNYYKYAQSNTTKENIKLNPDSKLVESSVGFLPFNLKIDMDGIGGIKIYNRVKVNTNFLPSNYGESLDFIIIGVNHKLENNSWTTSLSTTATSKSVLS